MMASPKSSLLFDPADYLARAGVGRRVVELKSKQTVFAQGDQAGSVFYIQKGTIKLTVLSPRSKEATLLCLMPGRE
jgi:CRP/FNR family transcriptional regulator, cyclic AMP receptor protein